MSKDSIDFDDVNDTPKIKPKSASIDLGGNSTPTEEVKASGIRGRIKNISVEEDRKGTWKGTNYNASDSEAHRDKRYRAPSLLNKLSVSILRNALIKVSGSWTVSGTSFTPSMSCLRGLPQLSGDFFLFTIPKIVLC